MTNNELLERYNRKHYIFGIWKSIFFTALTLLIVGYIAFICFSISNVTSESAELSDSVMFIYSNIGMAMLFGFLFQLILPGVIVFSVLKRKYKRLINNLSLEVNN